MLCGTELSSHTSSPYVQMHASFLFSQRKKHIAFKESKSFGPDQTLIIQVGFRNRVLMPAVLGLLTSLQQVRCVKDVAGQYCPHGRRKSSTGNEVWENSGVSGCHRSCPFPLSPSKKQTKMEVLETNSYMGFVCPRELAGEQTGSRASGKALVLHVMLPGNTLDF